MSHLNHLVGIPPLAGKSGDLRLRLGSKSKCAAQRHLAVERTKFSVSWIGGDKNIGVSRPHSYIVDQTFLELK